MDFQISWRAMGKKPGFNVHSRLKRTSDCDVTLVAKRLLSPQISPLTHFDGFIPTVATFLSAWLTHNQEGGQIKEIWFIGPDHYLKQISSYRIKPFVASAADAAASTSIFVAFGWIHLSRIVRLFNKDISAFTSWCGAQRMLTAEFLSYWERREDLRSSIKMRSRKGNKPCFGFCSPVESCHYQEKKVANVPLLRPFSTL